MSLTISQGREEVLSLTIDGRPMRTSKRADRYLVIINGHLAIPLPNREFVTLTKLAAATRNSDPFISEDTLWGLNTKRYLYALKQHFVGLGYHGLLWHRDSSRPGEVALNLPRHMIAFNGDQLKHYPHHEIASLFSA